ncbi:MAG TPA: hypothetical protein VIJ46_00010 [Rhabdochlamydiaceae bacterium]
MIKPTRLIFFFTAVLFTHSLFAATGVERNANDRDDVLREWVNTKRQITVKELGGALSITGEVHGEMQSFNEKRNGIRQRGPGGELGIAEYVYDAEVSMLFDYRADRTWSAVKIKYDNDAGTISGRTDAIKLDRAYLGARLRDADTFTVDLEIGRRSLGNIFDSKVEFSSLFDGILLKYDLASEKAGDFYAHAGVFLVNERRSQYAYVAELGMMRIANSNFYTKYSIIDWDTKDDTNIGHTFAKTYKNNFEFVISQLIFGYRWTPVKFKKTVEFYLAGVYNHAAHKKTENNITNGKRANAATYAGFTMGELKKKNDWSLDVNYQVVQAQAVADYDSSGIGLGNSLGSGFYWVLNPSPGPGSGPFIPATRKTAEGNVNFRGYMITLQYLITNNLNLFQTFSQSITLDTNIGPFRQYKMYELDMIYIW